MSFWDNLVKGVGDFASGIGRFFGGGNTKRRRDDEQSSQPVNFSTPSSSATGGLSGANRDDTPLWARQNEKKPELDTKKPQDLFKDINNALVLPGTHNKQANINKTSLPQRQLTDQERELEGLTRQNLQQAREDVSRGESLVDKVTNVFTGNSARTAQQLARTRAARQYQERHGAENDEGVNRYNQATLNLGGQTSRDIKRQQDTVDSALRASSQIPILSDFTAMGSGAASAIYGWLGNRRMADDAHDNWTKATLGMSDAELDSLEPEARDRLRNLQTALTVASPVMGALDIAAAGQTGAAARGLRTALTSGSRLEAGAAVRDALTGLGKNAAIAGASTPVVSAPIENYIRTGDATNFEDYDASNIPREMATGALWSVLLPGSGKSTSMDDVNNARLAAMRNAMRRVSREGDRATDAARRAGSGVLNVLDEGLTRPSTATSTSRGARVATNAADGAADSVIRTSRQVATAAPERPSVTAGAGRNIDGVLRTGVDSTPVAVRSYESPPNLIQDVVPPQGANLTNNMAVSTPEATPRGAAVGAGATNNIAATNPDASVVNVPRNTEATPGTVRETAAAAPTSEASSAIAAQPAPSDPVPTPTVQEILDNPKAYTKSQVATARRQAKLAEQYNSQQDRIATRAAQADEGASSPIHSPDFVETGEFGVSANGGAYQKVRYSDELQRAINETANMSIDDVLSASSRNLVENGMLTRGDVRNLNALVESGRVRGGTEEWRAIKDLLVRDGTMNAQALALRNRTSMRRTATANELIGQFGSKLYRMVDDPTKITPEMFDRIDDAITNFTDARDTANAAYEQFQRNATVENYNAFKKASTAADKADLASRAVEYDVARIATKGNKDIAQTRELQRLAQAGDFYQMDAIDASMLSGTGTFTRNFVNSTVGGVEEALFGKLGSKIGSKVAGETVGGGINRGYLSGLKEGSSAIADSAKKRAQFAGVNPLEHVKNWATTGNQLGDSVIEAQAKSSLTSHYRQQLKAQGYRGKELSMRADVMATRDPDSVGQTYRDMARMASGLGAGVSKIGNIESTITRALSDAISGGRPSRGSEFAAKAVTRVLIGFPTAVGRSAIEGAKRFSLGAPTFFKAFRTADPQQRALLIKEGIKQAGTGGAVIPPLFYSLGAAGVITGAYPSGTSAEAQEAQAEWEREGASANAIKIGDNYYELPAYLGAWAVPALFWARVGSNGGDVSQAAIDTSKIIPTLLPVDSASKITNVLNGQSDPGKFISQTASSAVRAITPGGAAVAEVAKMLDQTRNDTNTDDQVNNFINRVLTGIPGASNMVPDKKDAQGNTIRNPDPLGLLFGAASAQRQAGSEYSQQLKAQVNGELDYMGSLGVFADNDIRGVLTKDSDKRAYEKAISGEDLSQSELNSLKSAITKGVSNTGDSAYIEREQYGAHLAALSLKRQTLEADPTTKPSELAKLDLSIRRAQIYKNLQDDGQPLSYSDIAAYQKTSVSAWRAMGNPQSDSYDPETYQKLAAIDQYMAERDASYNTKDSSSPKYKTSSRRSGTSSRRSGTSSRRSGTSSSSMGSDFGKLKAGTGAPSVRQYEEISAGTTRVPVIGRTRPNIVHKISSS